MLFFTILTRARYVYNLIRGNTITPTMNTDVNNHSTAFGWIGIIAVVTYCTIIAICSVIADGSWTWCESVVSRFGINDNQTVRDIYNYGSIIFGLLLATYGIGRIECKKVGYVVGGILFIFAGACIAIMGLITCADFTRDIHRFFAMLTAIFIVLAMVAIALQYYRDGNILAIGFTLVIGIMAFACFTQFEFAKYETYNVLMGYIWIVFDSILMIKAGLNGGTKQ